MEYIFDYDNMTREQLINAWFTINEEIQSNQPDNETLVENRDYIDTLINSKRRRGRKKATINY